MANSDKRRILVSWIDYRHDFIRKPSDGPIGQPSQEGINYEAHKYWVKNSEYSKHILLQWIGAEGNDMGSPEIEMKKRAQNRGGLELHAKLMRDFPGRNIERKEVYFDDPLDFPMIQQRTQELLASLRDHDIDILINTGYQMMQLAWLQCHLSMSLSTRLLQVRKKEYTANKRPIPEEIIIDKSVEAYALLMQREGYKQYGRAFPPTLEAIYERAKIAASSIHPVLIVGESGTGKDLLAKFIHACRSAGRDSGYYAVNCAAFSDELLRSELFGHVKNSFTGALNDKQGFFEKAHGGTLFLDEIGDISPYMQQALLRTTQDGTYYRIGDTEERYTQVKLIAATNRSIGPNGENSNFRNDLYYRLSVLKLQLPSWRDYRLEERQLILSQLSESIARESPGKKEPKEFTNEAWQYLLDYHMPGNLRQLANLLRRLYVFYAKKEQIDLGMLKAEMEDYTTGILLPDPSLSLDELEKWHIQRALQLFNGNKSQASKSLGISVNTLKTKVERYGLL